jgi:predicted ATPase
VQPLWRICLFGGLSLQGVGGEKIRRFRSQKVAALLVYLALHVGRDCPREVLCALLWPEEDDLLATRNRLRVTLTSLRKQLEPPGIPYGTVLDASVTNTIRLRGEAVRVDTALFEAALRSGDRETAARLYAGELMPSFYDDWILEARERFALLAQGLESGAPLAIVANPVSMRAESAVPVLARRLPIYLTRFFGREPERERLTALLEDPQCRLVTLTGAGGQGKTRLSVEAAQRRTDRPMWFVALADLWDGSRLGEAIRDALALPRTARDPLEQAADFLNAQPSPLVILDNMEQIAPRAAPAVATLLSHVPALTVLVTSRSRLEIPGECEVPLAPLPMPTDFAKDLVALCRLPSVALFMDRAQSVRADFQITDRNAGDIVAICRLLDGIPLGIELAAARIAGLTPAQMVARLGEHWNALGTTHRRGEKSERRRSLRTAIEWSVALLTPDQRRLFVDLSVFHGGATLEAVGAVCELPHALDPLTRLRSSSLLRADERGGTLRFTALEVLRQWAAEQLSADETSALSLRHAHWLVERAEAFASQPARHEDLQSLESLEEEIANFRAALTWSLDAQPALFVRLSVALTPFWERRSYLREGREWLEKALVLLPEGAERTRTLLGAGILAARQGDVDAAIAWLEAGIAGARRRGDRATEAALRGAQGTAGVARGDLVFARECFETALDLYCAEGDDYGAAATLGSLGVALRDAGLYAEARQRFEETIAQARAIDGRRTLAGALNNLAALLYILDEDGAYPLWLESLTLKRELGDTHGVAVTLSNLAVLHCREGEWQEARTLTEEVCQMLRTMGDRRGLATALNRLGQIAVAQDRPGEGLVSLSEAFFLRRALGNPKDIATSLIALSDLVLEVQKPEMAALLLGAAQGWLSRGAVTLPPVEAAEAAQHRIQVENALGATRFARSHARGEALGDESIVAVLRQLSETAPGT